MLFPLNDPRVQKLKSNPEFSEIKKIVYKTRKREYGKNE
jgi:hypothetical protein